MPELSGELQLDEAEPQSGPGEPLLQRPSAVQPQPVSAGDLRRGRGRYGGHLRPGHCRRFVAAAASSGSGKRQCLKFRPVPSVGAVARRLALVPILRCHRDSLLMLLYTKTQSRRRATLTSNSWDIGPGVYAAYYITIFWTNYALIASVATLVHHSFG